MHKKMLATFLAFLLIGLSGICVGYFSHASAHSTHTNHEDISHVVCASCEQNSVSSMRCCFDAGEKPISITVSNRRLSNGHKLVSSPHITIAQFDNVPAKERQHLALAYSPPLIRVGIVVKKE